MLGGEEEQDLERFAFSSFSGNTTREEAHDGGELLYFGPGSWVKKFDPSMNHPALPTMMVRW